MSKQIITHFRSLELICDLMMTGMSYYGAKFRVCEEYDLCDVILQKPLSELSEYLASPFHEIRFAALLRYEELVEECLNG